MRCRRPWRPLAQHQRALTDGEPYDDSASLGSGSLKCGTSPHLSMELRKTIIRTVVREVIVNEDVAGERLRL